MFIFSNKSILSSLNFIFSVAIFLQSFTKCIFSVTNFSQDWESSSTQAITKYKAGTGKDINASIGVHIGLRGINITLKGKNYTLEYQIEIKLLYGFALP